MFYTKYGTQINNNAQFAQIADILQVHTKRFNISLNPYNNTNKYNIKNLSSTTDNSHTRC